MRCLLSCLALAAQACSFDLLEPVVVLENRCQTDSDCPGAHCELDMCVASSTDLYPITLEVTPASAGYGVDPPTIVLPAFALGGSDERAVDVPDPAVVFGNVRVGGQAIAAEVRFVAMTGNQTLTPRPISVTTTDGAVSISTGDRADYSAALLSDTDYRVTVMPAERAALPPLSLVLAAGTQPTRRFDAIYDSVRFSVLSIDVLGLPEGTWSVVAIDPSTAEEISTRATVSIANTLVTLASVEAFDLFDLVLAPVSEPGVATTLPTFRMSHTTLAVVNGTSTLELPTLSPVVSFTGVVEHCRDLSLEPDVGTRPAMSAALRSRSLLAVDGALTDAATFTTTATASYDASLREWSFSAQVPPGQYDVVVAPSGADECGVFAESREIQAPSQASAATSALLQLPTVSFLAGRVRAGAQMSSPVMGATVVANGLGLRDTIALEPNDETVTRYNRSQQTSTDGLGEFTLPIDVGAYDVLVKPPSDSGYAWHVLRDVNVGARTDTPFEREVNFSAPVLLRVVLETLAGVESMAGATVRAYTTTADAERGERALPLGSAVADEQGHFILLLPASIDQGWY
jgi:hypothetical protein